MGLPTNLPSILRAHGLKVVEHSGWKTRGRPGGLNPTGVLCHHTATGPTSKVANVINLLIRGRSDLAGPLCNLGLDRDGVVHIIAAGRANHAGRAKASGSMASASSGNGVYIGIEAFNAGTGEKWNKKQYDAYVLLCAVLSVKVTGNSVNTVRAHKETSVTGKIDPFGPTPYENSFDMNKFRSRVAAKMKVLTGTPSGDNWEWNPDVVSTLALVQEQFQIAAGAREGKIVRYHGVAAIQNALNVKFLPEGSKLAVDGIVDRKTLDAMKSYESKHGGTGRLTTPDPESLGPNGLQIMFRFTGPETGSTKPATEPKPEPAPKPVPQPTSTLKVMTWNVENKGDEDKDVAEIKKILNEHKPDVVCLQEGYKLYLGGIAGYKEVYHASKGYPVGSENSAQAILVRDGVSVKVKAPIEMALSWVGPKMGIKKDPRIHRYVTVNKDKKNWRVSTWHVPFGSKPVEETRKAAVKWLKTMGVLGPAIAVGDWNALASKLQAKVGTPAGAKVDGGHLDRAVFRGCTKVKGENLGKRGRSDHDVKIWTFKK